MGVIQYDNAPRPPAPGRINQTTFLGSISPQPFARRTISGNNGNNPISLNEVVLTNRYEQNFPPPSNEIAGNGLGK
jgi:hypothetical protein